MKPEENLAKEIKALVARTSTNFRPEDWKFWADDVEDLVFRYGEMIENLKATVMEQKEMIDSQADLIEELGKERIIFRRRLSEAAQKGEWYITLPRIFRWIIRKWKSGKET